MKKTMLIVVGLLVISAGLVHAEDSVKGVSGGAELVQLDSPTNRVGQLERRIDGLEREIRSQRDSIRNLERDLNDLRRRR